MGGGQQAGELPLPVVFVVVSLFVLMAFETGQAIHARSALEELRHSQQATVQEADKLRQQLQTLASKTAELAAAGDSGAKTVVDQMKRQHITLAAPKN